MNKVNHLSNVMRQKLHQNNIYVSLVLLLWRMRTKKRAKTDAFSKTEKSDKSNGESSFFFRQCAIKTKIAQYLLVPGSSHFT